MTSDASVILSAISRFSCISESERCCDELVKADTKQTKALIAVMEPILSCGSVVQITYEAYGAGGTGFIAECLTDNVNRSATDVRTAIVKAGGKMADSGSVLFNFQRQGLLLVTGATEEEVVGAHSRS